MKSYTMILIDGILEGSRTLKDGSVKVTFQTQEITPKTAGQLYEMANKYCYMAIKAEAYNDEETRVLEGAELEFKAQGKSPSQILRGVFHVLFKQDNKGYQTFDRYYDFEMDQITNHFKGKIKP